ncbi:C40 family peptidase [Peptoniphilus mikwangii]|uniref:C40 family peptidase n=1 Tax=Peptoniphilus mikwangii TaxID=1354300 RepID=UPI00042A2EEF|nr:C40 family peptidase [Peptoniphilus mikwangii]
MLNINKKVPMGVIALCAVSLFGLKDTGIFIRDHVQTTYSGNKVYFELGEKAEIVEKAKDGYIVAKGKARVTIPTEKIELTEVTTSIYKVSKNTSIKDKEGQIIRNLFLGEEVVYLALRGENFLVKCNDNVEGEVDKNCLELVSTTTKKIEPKKAIKVVEKKTNVVQVNILSNEEKEIQKVATAKITTSNVEKAKVVVPNVENGKVKIILDSAFDKLGTTYVYGSAGDEGYDCSGLIYAVYKKQMGINLPRSSSEQSEYGIQIERENLQAGDLVFFNTTGGGVSHVGIYIGNGEFIHASSGKGKVVVSNLNEKYYDSHYVNATRVL